jgi:hypothetical protein
LKMETSIVAMSELGASWITAAIAEQDRERECERG